MVLCNLIGETFGKLKVIALDKSNTTKFTRWICLCECGKIKSINAVSLKNKRSTSCGCQNTRKWKLDNLKIEKIFCANCQKGIVKHRKINRNNLSFCNRICLVEYNKTSIYYQSIGGINHNLYYRIHQWIKNHYGKAIKCEFCNRGNKKYEWALKKGCRYEKSRENFIQLCQSFHRKYDATKETANKQSILRKGKPIYYFRKPLIDINTGVFYDSVTEAANLYGFKNTTLSMMLTGKNKNKTSLRYA